MDNSSSIVKPAHQSFGERLKTAFSGPSHAPHSHADAPVRPHASSQRTDPGASPMANQVDNAGRPKWIVNPTYDPMPIPDPRVNPTFKHRANPRFILNPHYTGK